MVTTDPVDITHAPVVLAFSDAATNEQAIREIDEWARAQGFVRSREYALNVRQRPDGKRVFYGACYRLTAEDRRAAETDLGRIQARREAMPMTVPSSELKQDGD
jgi:hypothetical protein